MYNSDKILKDLCEELDSKKKQYGETLLTNSFSTLESYKYCLGVHQAYNQIGKHLSDIIEAETIEKQKGE